MMIFFWWGLIPRFLCESFRYSQIRLHPVFHCPRSSGSGLKVPGGGVVVVTPHHYHLDKLRVDQYA